MKKTFAIIILALVTMGAKKEERHLASADCIRAIEAVSFQSKLQGGVEVTYRDALIRADKSQDELQKIYDSQNKQVADAITMAIATCR